MRYREIINQVIDAFFPKTCPVCGELMDEKAIMCNDCLASLEKARLGDHQDNVLVRRFWKKVNVDSGVSVLRYRPDSKVSDLLMQIKYGGRPQLATAMGRWMATLDDVREVVGGADCIVPVPLTEKRLRERGYNQSECLAHGISEVLGIPVRTDLVKRVKFSMSQTRLTSEQRLENVSGVFQRIAETANEHLSNVVIVDDVITTGATMMAVADALKADVVSVLSLALAGNYHVLPYDVEQLRLEQNNEVTSAEYYF